MESLQGSRPKTKHYGHRMPLHPSRKARSCRDQDNCWLPASTAQAAVNDRKLPMRRGRGAEAVSLGGGHTLLIGPAGEGLGAVLLEQPCGDYPRQDREDELRGKLLRGEYKV